MEQVHLFVLADPSYSEAKSFASLPISKDFYDLVLANTAMVISSLSMR